MDRPKDCIHKSHWSEWHSLSHILSTFDEQLEQKFLQTIWHDGGVETFISGEERCQRLFTPFNKIFQEKKLRLVIVGGTNGKGEVVLRHHLSRAKKFHEDEGEEKTQIFTFMSPHIVSIRERFLSVSGPITYEELEQIHPKLLELRPWSFFEGMFLTFCLWVSTKAKEGDIVNLEVGVGGRLDATNYLDSEVSAITSIGRDHQDLLGDTLKKIFLEKAGIVRKKQISITCLGLDYLRQMMAEIAQKEEMTWFELKDARHYSEANEQIAMNIEAALDFQAIACPFPRGNHGITVLGRGERVTIDERTFILRGAHNRDGMRALQKVLEKEVFERVDVLILSFSKRKIHEVQDMLQMALSGVQNGFYRQIYVCPFEHFKAYELDVLKTVVYSFKEHIASKHIQWVDPWGIDGANQKNLERSVESYQQNDISQWWQYWPKHQRYLLAGSYYFLGQFLLSSKRHSISST